MRHSAWETHQTFRLAQLSDSQAWRGDLSRNTWAWSRSWHIRTALIQIIKYSRRWLKGWTRQTVIFMIKKGVNTTCDRCHRVNVHAFPQVWYYVYFCAWRCFEVDWHNVPGVPQGPGKVAWLPGFLPSGRELFSLPQHIWLLFFSFDCLSSVLG